MNLKWEMFYIVFIEVDLWLILFLKGENSGGMGCVLKSVILIYCRHHRCLLNVKYIQHIYVNINAVRYINKLNIFFSAAENFRKFFGKFPENFPQYFFRKNYITILYLRPHPLTQNDCIWQGNT